MIWWLKEQAFNLVLSSCSLEQIESEISSSLMQDIIKSKNSFIFVPEINAYGEIWDFMDFYRTLLLFLSPWNSSSKMRNPKIKNPILRLLPLSQNMQEPQRANPQDPLPNCSPAPNFSEVVEINPKNKIQYMRSPSISLPRTNPNLKISMTHQNFNVLLVPLLLHPSIQPWPERLLKP